MVGLQTTCSVLDYGKKFHLPVGKCSLSSLWIQVMTSTDSEVSRCPASDHVYSVSPRNPP